jgi:hypothetical protein
MDDKKAQPPKGQQINIELGEKEAEGVYSNLAIITHSSAEFVIDFTRVMPGVKKAKVQSRVIMTPQHAKLLLNALKDNIEKFEKRNGEIKAPGAPPQTANGFGFQPQGDKDENIH